LPKIEIKSVWKEKGGVSFILYYIILLLFY